MRRRILLGVLATAVIVITSGTLFAQSQNMNLWVGTWKRNIAKSKYSGPPPTLATSVTLQIVNGLLKITSDGVDDEGNKTEAVRYVKFDGKEQPVASTSPIAQPTTYIYKYIDDHTYEWVLKVNGQVTTTTRLSLAADRRSHTLTVTGKNAQGRMVNDTVVWEKQ